MKKELIGVVILFAGIFISIFVVNHTISKNKRIEEAIEKGEITYEEARWYEQLENGAVRCNLCPNRCTIGEGQVGICRVRKNIGGKLYSLSYGNLVSIHVDPIEKKPLYHFLPNSRAYSFATAGCNLDCKYCQNWDIAHRDYDDLDSVSMTPEEVVDEALKAGADVVAFTYNEPTVQYEFMFDVAKLAQEKGLRTVAISSGFINQEPLKELLPYMDAYKVDLKSFNEETYQTLISGSLGPVLETIKTVHESGTWLELVYLVVPNYTDRMDEIKNMCEWILANVGDDVPLHFSRFHPQYKLTNLPPTPEETVKKARQVCLDVGLKYVYTGNISNVEGSTTYCPQTGEPVLIRNGYFIEKNLIKPDGSVKGCEEIINGVWQ